MVIPTREVEPFSLAALFNIIRLRARMWTMSGTFFFLLLTTLLLEGTAAFSSPAPLRDAVAASIPESAGRIKQVTECTPGPGLATRHFKWEAEHGIFLAKVSKDRDTAAVDAEAEGLRALAASGCISVPTVHAAGELALGGGSFILIDFLQFVPFGQSIPHVMQSLGERMAHMHSETAVTGPPGGQKRYGFQRNTRLGLWWQDNTWENDFCEFFLKRRLCPQWRAASERYAGHYGTSNEDAAAFVTLEERLFRRVEEILMPVRDVEPSLLHGDLWVGNCGAARRLDGSREPVIFDPACWWGLAEFDLAVSMTFGKLPAPFYEAYHSVRPKEPGFDERMAVYRLYHLLNHLNLHGAGFGQAGTTESPKGYFERSIDLANEIIAGTCSSGEMRRS
jgi:protein-ribulosamine 3-kinase